LPDIRHCCTFNDSQRRCASTRPLIFLWAFFQNRGSAHAKWTAGRGDILLLLTDGITEVSDRRGHELGVDAIKSGLCEGAELPLPELFQRLRGMARDLKRRVKLHDDAGLHALRHTFLTEMGKTTDVFTLQKIASITTTMRDVHPQQRAIAQAFRSRLKDIQEVPQESDASDKNPAKSGVAPDFASDGVGFQPVKMRATGIDTTKNTTAIYGEANPAVSN
jgi:hypothetical protein